MSITTFANGFGGTSGSAGIWECGTLTEALLRLQVGHHIPGLSKLQLIVLAHSLIQVVWKTCPHMRLSGVGSSFAANSPSDSLSKHTAQIGAEAIAPGTAGSYTKLGNDDGATAAEMQH